MSLREKTILVRLNEEEEAQLLALTKKLGVAQSQVVRLLLRGAKVEEISTPTVILRKHDAEKVLA